MYTIIYVTDLKLNMYYWASHRGRIQKEEIKLVKEIKKQFIHDSSNRKSNSGLSIVLTANSFLYLIVKSLMMIVFCRNSAFRE